MPYLLTRSPGGGRRSLRLRTFRPALYTTACFVALLFLLSSSVKWDSTSPLVPISVPAAYPFAADATRSIPALDYAPDGLVKGWDAQQASAKRAGVRTVHPIDELRDRGQRRWDALLRRQSKTLAQATNEYRKRYSRDPPAGFDRWFEYCQENGVKIVDDYDQIDRDIRMWFAVQPAEFNRRLDMLDSTEQHQYTITLRPDGSSSVVGDMAKGARAIQHHTLLAPLARFLDREVKLVISNHDSGSHILNDELRRKLLDHVAAGTLIDNDELKRLEHPRDHGLGLVVVCPPDSAVRRARESVVAGNFTARTPYVAHSADEQTAFVYDTRPKMNFCDSPELLDLHGAFTRHGRKHCNLRPLFQQSKLAQCSDLLLTPLGGVFNASSNEGKKTTSTWEDKSIHKVFWRGSMTGDHYSAGGVKHRETYDWRQSHRPRLHMFANNGTGDAKVWVRVPGGATGGKDAWEQRSYPVSELSAAYLDVGLAGKVAQCDEADGTCAQMGAEIVFKGHVRPEDAKKYAYVLDTDGNGWSSRFHRLLSSGSVVVKTTIYPEWMSDWLTPWVHYVPVQTDYSDLYDVMSYFVGAPDTPSADGDAAARAIADAAVHFTRTHWRWEDMQAYMLRMVLEYARLGAEDRAAASYTGNSRVGGRGV